MKKEYVICMRAILNQMLPIIYVQISTYIGTQNLSIYKKQVE